MSNRPTPPCPPWCTINHDYFGPRHLRDIGQAIEVGLTTVETLVTHDRAGDTIVKVNYGTPGDVHSVAFTAGQCLALAWIISVCTLDEIRRWGANLATAAGILGGAE